MVVVHILGVHEQGHANGLDHVVYSLPIDTQFYVHNIVGLAGIELRQVAQKPDYGRAQRLAVPVRLFAHREGVEHGLDIFVQQSWLYGHGSHQHVESALRLIDVARSTQACYDVLSIRIDGAVVDFS